MNFLFHAFLVPPHNQNHKDDNREEGPDVDPVVVLPVIFVVHIMLGCNLNSRILELADAQLLKRCFANKVVYVLGLKVPLTNHPQRLATDPTPKRPPSITASGVSPILPLLTNSLWACRIGCSSISFTCMMDPSDSLVAC